MMSIRVVCLSIAVVTCLGVSTTADQFGSGDHAFGIEFVTVGDPGNLPDFLGRPSPAGSVDYIYRLAKFEISRTMIERANTQGDLGITLWDMTNFGGNGPNRPATGISWFEAARFVNWLNRASGHSEAYKFESGRFELWEPGDVGFDAKNLFRNRNAYYFLPTADEWYKAAYYDEKSKTYREFPTSYDEPPNGVRGGSEEAVWNLTLSDGPADIMNAGAISTMGTMAQGGNVWEWEESNFDLLDDGTTSYRGIRGGGWSGWAGFSVPLSRTIRGGASPGGGGRDRGFRVASVPEPRICVLFHLVTGFAIAVLRRRHAQVA